MSEARKVYVITEGDYSDKQVRCVVATEELARQAVEDRLGDEYNEYVMWEEMPPKISQLTISCHTKLPKWHHAAVELWREWEVTTMKWDHVDWTSECQVRSDGSYKTLSVTGTDHKKVRHVFGELKAKLRAEAEGIAT